MRIKRLRLNNFRNYRETAVEFRDGIHVIYGDNGAGKTTILEAIYYLALTKSFRSKIDKHLIRMSETVFRIEGEFVTEQGQQYQAAIAYSLDSGKHLTINGQKPDKFSDYIGDIPVVLLHPADLSLSQGGPQQRRRFLDVLLSQSSQLYLHHLIQYNRSLRQRNALLDPSRYQHDLVLSWEDNLMEHGIELIGRRRETAEALSSIAGEFYRLLSGTDEKIKIIYQCNVPVQKDADLLDSYRRAFEQKRSRERETATTIIGPHRDDLLILINGKPMRQYASQGEHKTLVIALKLAEFEYLRLQRQQAPILLFDDIFGELDAGRIEQMLTQLNDIGQVFVTTTSRTFFEKIQQLDAPVQYYPVQAGQISRAEA